MGSTESNIHNLTNNPHEKRSTIGMRLDRYSKCCVAMINFLNHILACFPTYYVLYVTSTVFSTYATCSLCHRGSLPHSLRASPNSRHILYASHGISGDIIEEEEGTCTNPAPCHALENVARPGRSRNWSGRARSAAWAS